MSHLRSANEKQQQIANALETLHAMMSDRGIVFDELLQEEDYPADSIFHFQKDSNIVLFFLNGKAWKEIVAYVEDHEWDKDWYYLIVVKDPSDLKKNKDQALTHYQTFTLLELQFNISAHELVPKHELITNEEEINDILTKHQVKKTQLPWIQKTDPMSRYLNAKVGHMIKVTRVSPTCGTSIVYRSVV